MFRREIHVKHTLLREKRWERDAGKRAALKILVFQYFAVAIFLLLVGKFWDLQIRNPEFYLERADENRIKALPILAPRGKILDREGRVIVDNHAAFSLLVSREEMRPAHLEFIASGLDIDGDALRDRVKSFASKPGYMPIIIKEELTAAELAFVEAHRGSSGYPSMELIHAHRRLYPRDGLGAHLLGYVGEVSEAELNQIEFATQSQGDLIGKWGIERQYNHTLMGVDGQRRVVVDSAGRERDVEARKDAIPGTNLDLTIDLDLQAVAEIAMDGKRGAVVALNPRNGEVLAMVSRPSFDANRFTGRIRSADWKEIMENPDNPMLNRAIQAQLAPGSTFKPVVALAGLEKGVIDENFRAYCRGSATFYNHTFRCHRRGGHGWVNLYTALAQSCDVYFYTVGSRLGIEPIANYARMVGFGEVTGIDLAHEAEGLIPSPTWKLRTQRQKWYPGETISVAIGQGAVIVTPLQLAYAIGGMANGGVFQQPHVVKTLKNRPPPRRIEVRQENLDQILDGLWAVVNDGGTAGRSRLPGVEMCGKTGTAQVVSNAYLARARGSNQRLRDNAWFVGFAPKHNPEIAVAVLLEQGLHGNWAAPVARDIIRMHFDKKSRPPSGIKELPEPRQVARLALAEPR